MLRGHNNVLYGGRHNFLYTRMDLTKMFVMPLDFAEIKYRKHVHGDDIQDALSPSTPFFFIYF